MGLMKQKNGLMNKCNDIVLEIYNHPDLIKAIGKTKPESIQDDLGKK